MLWKAMLTRESRYLLIQVKCREQKPPGGGKLESCNAENRFLRLIERAIYCSTRDVSIVKRVGFLAYLHVTASGQCFSSVSGSFMFLWDGLGSFHKESCCQCSLRNWRLLYQFWLQPPESYVLTPPLTMRYRIATMSRLGFGVRDVRDGNVDEEE